MGRYNVKKTLIVKENYDSYTDVDDENYNSGEPRLVNNPKNPCAVSIFSNEGRTMQGDMDTGDSDGSSTSRNEELIKTRHKMNDKEPIEYKIK